MAAVIIDAGKVAEELAMLWNQSGLHEGDTVLVHSSLSGFLKSYRESGRELSP